MVLVYAEGPGSQHIELGGRALEHVAVAPDGTLWAFVPPGELVAVDAPARVLRARRERRRARWSADRRR